ncbi:MAG: hypothetical protein M3355_01205 [Actinomycetota bacterium]|nr:hypothetical protein [Actinomycetota bacterium]
MKHELKWLTAPLAVLAVLAIAACGSSGSGSSGGEPGQNEDEQGALAPSEEAQEASLKFVECMRENGIDMEDPEPGMTGVTIDADSGIDVDSPEFKAAEEACRDFLEGALGGSGVEPTTEIPDEALAFAECMREQGIDFPDPRVADGRLEIGPDDPNLSLDDPEMTAASEKCREHLPEMAAP